MDRFTADQLRLVDAPSITGDVARLDVTGLPERGGAPPDHLEIERDDGSGPVVSTLDMWIRTGHPRYLRVTPGTETQVRVRAVWHREDETFDPGPWTEPLTVTPSVGAARVEIGFNRDSGTAPAGMMFTAEGLGFGALRPYHDIHYRWSFDDPGLYDRLARDLPWERDRNVAFGPVVAHTFEAPGTYTVTCEASHGDRTETGTVSVTVTSADTAFPGIRTICVSQNGDFTGAPEDAVRVASLEAAMEVPGRGSNVRFLLRRGETFRSTGAFRRFSNLAIGAFGPGFDPPPVWLGGGGISIRDVPGEVSVSGLDLVGPYEIDRPENTILPPDAILLRSGAFKTIHDCRMTGWNINIRPVGSDRNIVVSNCEISSWMNYGALIGDPGWIGFAGTAIRQSPMAYNDAGKFEEEPPFAPDHGPIRLSRPRGPVCFTICDLASFNSWTGTRSHQPTIRWNTGGQGGDPAVAPLRLSLDRLRSEGAQFGLGGTTGQRQSTPQEIVIDKLHHITTMQPTAALNLALGGLTLRNAVVVQADVPPESPTGLRIMLSATVSGPNLYEPLEVYNVTILDLRRADHAQSPNNGRQRTFVAYRPRGSNAAEYPRVRVENIVAHAPNGIPEGPFELQADAPLDLTPRWTPLYRGRRITHENGGATQTEYANPPEAAVLPVPLTGSTAIGDAAGRVAYDDFFGAPRGPDPSRGAFEPRR